MTKQNSQGRPRHPDVLTPGEWRVAELLRHGLTNRAIAELQGISADAVKFHVANVLGKLGFRRRSEVRQWSGIRADSNLAKIAIEEIGELGFGELGQVARGVANIGDSERWYRDVLGLPHLYTFGKFAFFDCNGVRLFLSEGEANAAILYFSVQDIRRAYVDLQARGAEFIAAPHLVHRHADTTEEWMAFFNDNEGRPLAIMSKALPINPKQSEGSEPHK